MVVVVGAQVAIVVVHSFKVVVVPVDAGPLGQLGFVLPARALVLPGVQIHDQILWLRVAVPHLALVAVLVRGHLVRVEGQIRRLVAGLGGHRYLEGIEKSK